MNRAEERFNECVRLMQSVTDKDGRPLSMNGLSVCSDGDIFFHQFTSEGSSADLRSVSKVITAIVLGNVIDRKIAFEGPSLTLDSPVLEFLGRQANKNISGLWRNVTIRNLMNNTIGHEEGFLFRKDIGDRAESEYIEYIFEAPIVHAPGTHFSYSNVGPYLISIILQAVTGRSLLELSRESVLEPLGATGTWRNFGDFTAGCTGLVMSCENLLKIAMVLRDNGSFEGKEVVSAEWVEEMKCPITLTPRMCDPSRVFPKYAYGLGLWICENGSFYCDGTNGQYLIVVPSNQLAISTTGNQPDMKPITRCMLPLLT
jgi:CubicO group peptidase (beta-lactamase class C family)